MGHSVSSVLNPVKATKNALKVVKSTTKNSLKAALNPVKATKRLVRNPMGFLAELTGADVLFGPNASPQQPRELADYQGGENEDASPQERARMLSRQGMQGTTPIMLLGQDYQDPALDHDEKLGGKDV